MDLLSPLKACDPWAVYSAQPLAQNQGGNLTLNPVQEKIIKILKHGPTEYYNNKGNNRNRPIELDLPDKEEISEPVYNALMHGRLAQMADLGTLNDFKLLQIGWVYDLNFSRTFQIVRENGYLEKIRDALPPGSSRVTDIYERAIAYLERNCLESDNNH